MATIIPFNELFPLTSMPQLAMRVFAWNPTNDLNEGITLTQVAALLGVTNPEWANIQNKPSTFTPSAHTLGSHSNVDSNVDSVDPDGVVFGKVGGVWKSVVLNYASPGDIPDVPEWVLEITEVDIANWNQAFGWGNPSGLYKPIGYVPAWSEITDKPSTFTPSAHTIGSHSDASITGQTTGQLMRWNGTAWENWTHNFLTSFTESDPVFTASAAAGITIGNIAMWNDMVNFLASVEDLTVPYAVGGELKTGKLKVVLTENPDPEDLEFVPEVESYEFEVPVKILPGTEPEHPVRMDQITDPPIGKRVVNSEYTIESDTDGELVHASWYNELNELKEVTNQAIVFDGATDAGELRWDVMTGNEDGTATLLSGVESSDPERPTVPSTSVVLFELIWNEEGESVAPPSPESNVWSTQRYSTSVLSNTDGKYSKIMEMDLGFAKAYSFILDYGAPASLEANKVGSLHVAFVTTEANIIHSPTVKLTTVGFSEDGDFVLVALPDNKAGLFHKSTNYFMMLQWRVTYHSSNMSLDSFKSGNIYDTLPSGSNWASQVYGMGEPAFAKGDLIAGTNVTMDGSLTGRLVGAGNVTINATGGGSGSGGRVALTGFPVIPFDQDYYYAHEMAGPVEISVNTSLARTFPKNTILYIKANGTDKPTFLSSDNFAILYDGWNNTNGEWNRFRLEWSPQGNPVVQIMDTSGAANPGTGATDFELLFDADYSFSHVIAGTVSLSVDATGAAAPKQTIFYFMADGTNKPMWSSDIECNFDNYVNEAGVWNRFFLEYTPENKVTLQIQNT